jgi:polar amino acid transport system substrate-binding protein
VAATLCALALLALAAALAAPGPAALAADTTATPPPSPAGARLDTARNATLILGCPSKGWPPYMICSEGRAGGVYHDILTASARPLGLTVLTRELPERRIGLLMQEGEVDVYTKAKAWVDDPDAFLWSVPLFDSEDALLFRAGRTFPFRRLEDLDGHNVGTVLGFGYPTLEPLLRTGRLQRRDAPDSVALVRMLRAGRFEAVVINRHMAAWIIRKNLNLPPEEFAFSTTSVDTQPIRLMFPDTPRMRALAPALDRALLRLRAKGFVTRVLRRYCGPDAR